MCCFTNTNCFCFKWKSYRSSMSGSRVLDEGTRIPSRPVSMMSTAATINGINDENSRPISKMINNTNNNNKRNSILSYTYMGKSRIPRPVLSSHNLNADLLASSSMNNLSLSHKSETVTESTGIPRSPSSRRLKSVNNEGTNRRHSFVPLHDQRRMESKQSQRPLKFNYYTSTATSATTTTAAAATAPAKPIIHKPLSRIDSVNSISSIMTSSSKLKRSSTTSTLTVKPRKRKVKDIEELLETIRMNRDIKYRLKFENHTLFPFEEDKLKPYKYEELSSRRVDLFEKLSMFERIAQYPEIYFTGLSKSMKIGADVKDHANNYGFDDSNHNYKIIKGDHIKYKYEIIDVLGKGAFGTVVTVRDHSYRSLPLYACKIVKNDPKLLLQSVEEIKILKQMQSDNIVKYVEHFTFRSHMCIVTELLTLNLYELIQMTNFSGFSIDIVKRFTIDILRGLEFIHSFGIIHCDMKPENLMLTQNGRVKIIDFGSSCKVDSLRYSYLQSRFYRAPEVLLGARYDTKIDIWSVALIALELYAGVPSLQPQNEWELFCQCIEYFNVPSRKLIIELRQHIIEEGPVSEMKGKNKDGSSKGTLLWKGFDSSGGLNREYVSRKQRQRQRQQGQNKVQRQLTPGSRSISRWVRQEESGSGNGGVPNVTSEGAELAAFAELLLRWNPCARLSARKALREPFLHHVGDVNAGAERRESFEP